MVGIFPSRQVEKALKAREESSEIDFKEGFNPNSKGEWCELLKDIFALVNSGGGAILFGVRTDGTPSMSDLSLLNGVDPAAFTDKIAAYTGTQYSSFSLVPENRDGQPISVLNLAPIELPLIPIRPGTYEHEPGRQKTAFSMGIIYFRHGAKSEPGNAADIGHFIERRLRQIRRNWLSGVRRVVTAPTDSVVSVVVNRVTEPSKVPSIPTEKNDIKEGTPVNVTGESGGLPIRLTNNPEAPAYRLVTPDEIYPYRTMEFITVLNQILAKFGKLATSHDVRLICSLLDPSIRAGFCYQPKFGPKKYSLEFAEWIANKVAQDRNYLLLVRSKYRRQKRYERKE